MHSQVCDPARDQEPICKAGSLLLLGLALLVTLLALDKLQTVRGRRAIH
jgi:hypothetical protein